MLKHLLKKYGLIYATLFSTGISIFVSVIITASLMSLFKMPNMDFSIIIAIICPLVIAPPVSYFWLRLLGQAIITQHKLQKSNQRLKLILKEVKELSGLLPICASCKKIRDDKGYWNQIESYIKKHSKAEFSHSVCPECVKELYPEI
ncbi:sensor protein with HAMP domain [Candidatus Scalindua japonica]|uniref:Sensor protein with HAMP domain n=1 Tax=Candidatus Scalindua japonica TaxID=1284222 RepID=A0A286U0R1_9BACT|nr:hypothetical protein [Candidatus Scalindua japonica]GAX61661.1 sensor protein with HAMP domain [Candidatus Scalindua japonica]